MTDDPFMVYSGGDALQASPPSEKAPPLFDPRLFYFAPLKGHHPFSSPFSSGYQSLEAATAAANEWAERVQL